MRRANGIFLLSIIFVFCLHGAISSQQWLHNNESDGSNSPNIVREFTVINRRLHVRGRDRNRNTTSVAKTSSAGDRVTSSSSNAQLQVEYRRYGGKPTKYSKQNFATSLPLLRHSTHVDNNISKPITSNNSTAVDARISYRPYDTDYDRIPGTKYLCVLNSDCAALLKRSLCGFENYCRCAYPTIFDGETCLSPDFVHDCATHRDCSLIEGSRCVLVQMTGRKMCMCRRGYILDVYRCLRKVDFLEDCVSEKQCPVGEFCLGGICRLQCDVGQVWRFPHCVDEFPRIPPIPKIKHL